jgi:hypothetical protein
MGHSHQRQYSSPITTRFIEHLTVYWRRNAKPRSIDRKDQRMKKFAATFLLTGLLAVAGFAAPAMADPKSDTAVSTSSKTTVTQSSIGWWPN